MSLGHRVRGPLVRPRQALTTTACIAWTCFVLACAPETPPARSPRAAAPELAVAITKLPQAPALAFVQREVATPGGIAVAVGIGNAADVPTTLVLGAVFRKRLANVAQFRASSDGFVLSSTEPQLAAWLRAVRTQLTLPPTADEIARAVASVRALPRIAETDIALRDCRGAASLTASEAERALARPSLSTELAQLQRISMNQSQIRLAAVADARSLAQLRRELEEAFPAPLGAAGGPRVPAALPEQLESEDQATHAITMEVGAWPSLRARSRAMAREPAQSSAWAGAELYQLSARAMPFGTACMSADFRSFPATSRTDMTAWLPALTRAADALDDPDIDTQGGAETAQALAEQLAWVALLATPTAQATLGNLQVAQRAPASAHAAINPMPQAAATAVGAAPARSRSVQTSILDTGTQEVGIRLAPACAADIARPGALAVRELFLRAQLLADAAHVRSKLHQPRAEFTASRLTTQVPTALVVTATAREMETPDVLADALFLRSLGLLAQAATTPAPSEPRATSPSARELLPLAQLLSPATPALLSASRDEPRAYGAEELRRALQSVLDRPLRATLALPAAKPAGPALNLGRLLPASADDACLPLEPLAQRPGVQTSAAVAEGWAALSLQSAPNGYPAVLLALLRRRTRAQVFLLSAGASIVVTARFRSAGSALLSELDAYRSALRELARGIDGAELHEILDAQLRSVQRTRSSLRVRLAQDDASAAAPELAAFNSWLSAEAQANAISVLVPPLNGAGASP